MECQINDNMFWPFLILTRPSSCQTYLLKRSIQIVCFVCSSLATMFDLMRAYKYSKLPTHTKILHRQVYHIRSVCF